MSVGMNVTVTSYRKKSMESADGEIISDSGPAEGEHLLAS